MALGVLASVEDYLRTSYSPDRDYVDGELVERNLGEFEHSSAQREILLFLATHYPQLRKRLLPEQLVQVGRTDSGFPMSAFWPNPPPGRRSSTHHRNFASRFFLPRTR